MGPAPSVRLHLGESGYGRIGPNPFASFQGGDSCYFLGAQAKTRGGQILSDALRGY